MFSGRRHTQVGCMLSEECSQVRNMISVGGILSQVRHALRAETHSVRRLGKTLSERDVVSVKRRALLEEVAHSA